MEDSWMMRSVANGIRSFMSLNARRILGLFVEIQAIPIDFHLPYYRNTRLS
jgi:hypothetical protein